MRSTTYRRRVLDTDENGYREWQMREETRSLDPTKAGIIVCDVWDLHWCRGANERLSALLPRMEKVLTSAREHGVTIIHAPSDTLEFYEGNPARERIRNMPRIEPPSVETRSSGEKDPDPPLPVDASDGGPDTADNPGRVNERGWSRQHPSISIDPERDLISDDGREIYSFLESGGIQTVFIMGVHTNMCVLNRTFGIKQMVRWGVDISLCRDLTDAMYNPAMPPYVSHAEGTGLVIEYIEKFWCPSVMSEDLL